MKDALQMNVHKDGTKLWKLNGELHHATGAAIECANDNKVWLMHGKLHRINGPAVEYTNGVRSWYEHGKLHRIDGAAVECADGNKEWWVDNIRYFDLSEWARAALMHQGKECTEEMIEQKIIHMMHNDVMQM